MAIISTIIAVIAVAAAAYTAYTANQLQNQNPGTGVLVSKHSADEGLRIVYGQRRIAATKVFKTASGNPCDLTATNYDSIVYNINGENKDNHRYLHRVDVWALGPIESIVRYYIDGDPHTAARFQGTTGKPYFRAVEYYGTGANSYFKDLADASSQWTSTHIGYDVCYSATRYYWSDAKPQYNGEPEVHAVIKGRKIYDPRKDSTRGGSGSHLWEDATTWEWSDNAALCLLDYLTQDYGRGLDLDTWIDVDSFKVGADYCEATVTIPERRRNLTGGTLSNWWNNRDGIFENIGSGSFFPNFRPDQSGTSQSRIALNIALDPKDSIPDNVRHILAVMRGSLPFSQGKFKLAVEDSADSVMDFDLDNIIGGLRIAKGDRSKRYNQVTIEFPNANKDFQPDQVSWPDKNGSLYQTLLDEDNGEVLQTTIKIEGVTDWYQAEDLAEFIVRDSRVGLHCEITLAPIACLLEPGDVITLTHPTPDWESKKFRVRSLAILEDGNVKVKLTEYNPTVYTWGVKNPEPLQPPTNLPNPWADGTDVTSLTATPFYDANGDETVVNGFDLTWTNPTDDPTITETRIFYKRFTDPEWRDSIVLGPDDEKARISGLADSGAWDFMVRRRTGTGRWTDGASVTNQTMTPAPTKLTGIEPYSNQAGLMGGLVSDPNFDRLNAHGWGSTWDKSESYDENNATLNTDGGRWGGGSYTEDDPAIRLVGPNVSAATGSTIIRTIPKGFDLVSGYWGSTFFYKIGIFISSTFAENFRVEAVSVDRSGNETRTNLFDDSDITANRWNQWIVVEGFSRLDHTNGDDEKVYIQCRVYNNGATATGYVDIDFCQVWQVPFIMSSYLGLAERPFFGAGVLTDPNFHLTGRRMRDLGIEAAPGSDVSNEKFPWQLNASAGLKFLDGSTASTNPYYLTNEWIVEFDYSNSNTMVVLSTELSDEGLGYNGVSPVSLDESCEVVVMVNCARDGNLSANDQDHGLIVKLDYLYGISGQTGSTQSFYIDAADFSDDTPKTVTFSQVVPYSTARRMQFYITDNSARTSSGGKWWLSYVDIIINPPGRYQGQGAATIASGAISIAGKVNIVDTESAASTDDLDTINGGYIGQEIIVKAANDARTVVMKDGTGNLNLAGDFSLDNSQDTIKLIWTGSAWDEVARSDNGA